MFTKRLFALATLLFLCTIAFSQQVTMGSRTSHLKLGFNFGGAWQQSDIRSNPGFGLGTTLELAIIENEYSAFGMSLRGRYLYSDIKGKDLKATTGFRNNPALTGKYNSATDYTSSGSIFQNFHSRIDQLDLELMITLNRLRRHGILLYGFGGAGFTGYRVNTDQLDANGNTYDYSKITGTSESEIKSQLDALRDKNYETRAENKGRPDWAFAPSYGAGLGFYLSPYVVLGFEHKVTHPATDLLDGQQWYNNNERTKRNDVYHYTTLFFRMDLFGGKYRGDRSTTTPPTTKTDYNNYTAAPLKPEIYVNNPLQNPFNGCYADIQLTIKNIESKSSITVRQDGALIDPSLYDFSSVSGMFTYRTNLQSNSTFAVTAENSAGSKTSYLSFTCSRNDFTPVQPLPLVRITAPSTNPFNSTNCNQVILATIDNIQGKNNIEVRKDGTLISSSLYDFNSTTRIFTMNTTLAGSSTFTIKASNGYGSDSKSVTMSCAAPIPRVFKPIIIVSSPGSNPYTSPNCVADIFATIHNIESKNNIEVRQNGATISSVHYNYDPNTKRFTLNTPIREITVFTILAANNGGTETATITIKCEPVINTVPVIPKPVITIVRPTSNPYLSADCKSGINAVIVNIDGKQNIEVRRDGQIVNSSLYSYDVYSKTFSLNTDIKEITTFTITAVNASGKETASVTIKCEPKHDIPVVAKPVITVIKPASDPYIAADCKTGISAVIVNVDGKQNIEVRENGQTLGSNLYSYDINSKLFALNKDVKEITTYTITAVNAAGRETATLTIKCEPKQNDIPVLPKPIISVISPVDNPHVSNDCKSAISAAILNVQGKQNLEVRQNGQIISSSLYNYDVNSKIFTLNTDVKEVTIFTITAANASGKETVTLSIKCEPKIEEKPVLPKPVITVTNPLDNPHVAPDCKTGLKANILFIDGKQNIEVRQNGQIISSNLYSYDAATKTLTLNADIKEITTYTITAANASGKESAVITIKCEPKQEDKPVIAKPVITVTSPTDNPHVATDCKTGIKATILNIDGKQNLEVRQNGQIISSALYSFDAASKTLTLNADIKEITTYTITAVNVSGKESAVVTIKCEPKVEEKPATPKPVITVISPMDNPHVTADCKTAIKATVANIDGKQNIEVRQNGQIINSSLYSYDAATKVLTLNADIKEVTAYTITAANASGKEAAVVTIKCEPKVEPVTPKPVITVTSPGSNPYLAPDCKVNLKATILNVDGKQSIEVRQNGQIVSNSLYNYDVASKVLSLSSDIKTMTAYTITAVNGAGKVSEVITINCEIKEEEKVTICHLPPGNTGNPQTLTIPVSALKAHLDHGDMIGTCEEVEKKKKEAEEKEEKVTICHLPPGNTGNPQTLTIPKSALKAHLDHGDVLGTCDEVERKKKEEEEKLKREKEEKEKKELEEKLKKEKEAEDKNTPKVDFEINNGTVIPRQCANASVTVVGCALKEGGVGIDYPVIVQVKFGSSTIDPFGTYNGYNKTSNINDHTQHTWNSNSPIAPNTAISVKAKSINPKSGALLYERNSSTNDPFVRVLRNGDVVPKVAGFAGQADAEAYLKGYIVNGKMNLQANQAIYLFELGTNSTTSTSNDLQDCVVLVTLSPAECSGTINLEEKLKKENEERVRKDQEETLKKENEERERMKREADERTKQAEAERLKREQEEKLKKENEERERIKKEQEERLKKELEDKAKREQEERLKKEAEEKEEKVTICHLPPGNTGNPQTITIPKSALKAHLDHGDKIGACEEEEKVTICHMPPGNPGNAHTLSVPKSALKAHLDHGDIIGTCDEIELKKKKDEEDRIKKENEEKVKKEAEDKLKKELEDKTKRDEEERLKKEAEDKAKKEAENNEEKVTICHMPPGNPGNAHTLSVPKSALKAHLDHGDVIGTCDEIELKKKKEAEEKAKKDEEERIKKENDERLKKEVEEKLRKDLEERERIKKENEEKLKKEQEDKSKREEEDRLNREVAEKAKRDEQERLNREAAEKAKHDEQERLNREAAEKAKREEQERLNREAAEKAKRDEQERLNREAAEKAKREEQERLNREAAEKAKRDEQDRINREAAEKAKRDEQERLNREAAEKAKREEQERLHREAEEKAKREAAEKAKHEEEERLKREAAEKEKQNSNPGKKDGE